MPGLTQEQVEELISFLEAHLFAGFGIAQEALVPVSVLIKKIKEPQAPKPRNIDANKLLSFIDDSVSHLHDQSQDLSRLMGWNDALARIKLWVEENGN